MLPPAPEFLFRARFLFKTKKSLNFKKKKNVITTRLSALLRRFVVLPSKLQLREQDRAQERDQSENEWVCHWHSCFAVAGCRAESQARGGLAVALWREDLLEEALEVLDLGGVCGVGEAAGSISQ